MSRYSFEHKNDRPWPNERLGIAVIIGHTDASTARIWVRTNDDDPNADYRLLVFNRKEEHDGKTLSESFTELRNKDRIEEADLEPFNPHKVPASPEQDTTAVLDVPVRGGVDYSYALWASKHKALVLGHDKRRRFRTPTAAGDDFAFGLFSCHNPFGKPKKIDTKIGVKSMPRLHNMRLWDIARMSFQNRHDGASVDLVIAGGDQAYCDGSPALDIWSYLEKTLRGRKPGEGLLPSQDDMLSWYRDMYRGYWGFQSVKAVFGSYPTYMIWDDHEIRDGWGSYKLDDPDENELDEILFDDWKEHLSYPEARQVLSDMFAAARTAYFEYEHSRNPKTKEGIYDYGFTHKNSMFYVLDGRGHRDFDRESHKILGREQLERFRKEMDGLDTGSVKHLFVVSAVPLVHAAAWLVNRAEGWFADGIDVTDDLRDAWEHPAHSEEKNALTDILFRVAGKGVNVCILSGDVHMDCWEAAEGDRQEGKCLHSQWRCPHVRVIQVATRKKCHLPAYVERHNLQHSCGYASSSPEDSFKLR